MKAFVIAGTSTGVGKTTVTAALIAALRARGLTIQPFKCGPDYIDPAHHAALAERPSYNLDTWMMSADTNRSIFRRASQHCDVAVVEGVMGLFDGVSGTSEEGSTAEIAKLLGLPVILVLDASTAARSAGAMVQGFRDFDPQLQVRGVILNRAAGPGHVQLLRDAISPTGVPILGWLPSLADAELQERHLGLVTAAERTWNRQQIDRLAEAAADNIDLDLLLRSSEIDESFLDSQPAPSSATVRARIGIARDYAFSFYYQSSLDALCHAGAELVPFSPVQDTSLPAGLDGLYLGGGYPEVFAEKLAANTTFLESLRDFAASGRPIYAECGGLMYLGEAIITRDGRRHRMASILPLSVEMLDHLEGFGYTEVEVVNDCLVGPAGTKLRGHSFHYSRVLQSDRLDCRYGTRQVLTGMQRDEGYCAGNVLAAFGAR